MIFSYFFQAALGIAFGLSLGFLPVIIWWSRRNKKLMQQPNATATKGVVNR